MEEKQVRQLTKDFVLKAIDDFVDNYINRYQTDIGFLMYYPLLAIEYRFQEELPMVELAEIDRKAIGWFLGLLKKKNINSSLKFSHIEVDLQLFIKEELPQILKYYLDYLSCDQIIDDRSIAKSQFEQIDDGEYKLTFSMITGGFRKEWLYFNGVANKDTFKLEIEAKEAPAKRIAIKYKVYNKSSYHKIKHLLVDIDRELFDLSYKCVETDLKHLGGNIKSNVINYLEELKLILAFFHYCSTVLNYYNHIGKLLKFNTSVDFLYYYDENWLIKKVSEVTKLNDIRVKTYIEYFAFIGEGSLLEFPLIRHEEKVMFVPSMWLLNDFQFSIVNGHYYKNKIFTNRHKTISTSVVDGIIDKIKDYSNIIYGKEVYYEIREDKVINSDIDVALYDKNSNSFIIIECKWKDNHYLYAGNENYRKIHQSLDEIYKEQISKHKIFINSSKENLSIILEGKLKSEEIPSDPDIIYIAVDKRSQLYIDDKILISSYGLLALIEKHSNNNNLNLAQVIEELNNQKTVAQYINIGELKEIKINDSLTIITDEFSSFIKGGKRQIQHTLN